MNELVAAIKEMTKEELIKVVISNKINKAEKINKISLVLKEL